MSQLDFAKVAFRRSRRSALFSFCIAVTTIVPFFFGGSALAAFTEPSTAPPNGNADAPLNTGSAEQVKSGILDINEGWVPDQQLSIDSNQIWTSGGDLYFQYARPGGVVVGGASGAQNNFSVYGDAVINPTNGGIGDLYVGNSSVANVAIRTDGTNAYIFPWGTGPTGNVYLGGGGQNTNFIIAKGSLCLNGSCISSWPSSSAAASCAATDASTVYGSGGYGGYLPAMQNGGAAEIDHGSCAPIWYVCVDGTWALTQHASGCGW